MKINYQDKMEKQLSEIIGRPKLLLHSCCGPCSTYVLEVLNNFFEITIYYYNPNIYPSDEFNKRYEVQQSLVKSVGLENDIKIIKGKYDEEKFNKQIKGYESLKEGSYRCTKCFELRLEVTCKYAKENGFDYFTTSLSVSPYKNSEVLNSIGEKLSDKYDIEYLYADFKKKDGYKKSIELSKKYNLYRQEYCGCKYSLIESNERRNVT
jgi:Uncharacterized protein conserved in bacteria